MSDIVKSIFRQRELEKMYEVSIKRGTYSMFHSWCDDRSLSVDLGTDYHSNNVISDKIIGSYDIEIPMLEVGDEFFLHDIEEVVTIDKRMRSSDGSITYYVKDKYVDTENSLKSKEECRNKIALYGLEKEKFDELNEKLASLEKEFEDYKREYKYKNRFFNGKQS